MDNTDREYQVWSKRGRLRFRTSSFRTETGSALHSGIYNRELVASLAAGAVLVVIALIAVYKGLAIGKVHYIAAFVLFALLTFLFRVYVFYEEYLDLLMDKNSGVLNVKINSMFKKSVSRRLDDLQDVTKGYTMIAPKNRDGIEIVKNISLQHGMVVPGLGEIKEYHSVNLEFDGLQTLAVFATEDPEEAEAVFEIIQLFVGGGIAKAQ